jgi:hypothetical protein
MAQRWKLLLRNIAVVVVGLILLLALAGALYQAIATSADARPIP